MNSMFITETNLNCKGFDLHDVFFSTQSSIFTVENSKT